MKFSCATLKTFGGHTLTGNDVMFKDIMLKGTEVSFYCFSEKFANIYHGAFFKTNVHQLTFDVKLGGT